MTTYRNLKRVIVEFQDREGVPSALILDNPPEDAYAEVSVDSDGLGFEFLARSTQDNTPGAFHFKGLEDWELKYVRRDEEDGQGVKNKAELGPVGKGIMTAILLAFLTPVIWVVWDATIRWIQR